MDTQRYLDKSIDQALSFIESVKERLLEIKANPSQIQTLDKNVCFSYHEVENVNDLTKDRLLYLRMKDGSEIRIARDKDILK